MTLKSIQIPAFIALTLLAFAGCSKNNSNNATPAEPQLSLGNDSTWLKGKWHVQGEPGSWGDLGADIREIDISDSEITLETFGHLAAENGSFNTDGFDYGGNCLYRIHGRNYGIQPDPSSGSPALFIYRDSFEYIDDPGNRNDCHAQIDRINAVNQRQRERTEVGAITQIDADDLQLNGRLGLKTYQRLQPPSEK